MINRQSGIVTEIQPISEELWKIKVLINGAEGQAYALTELTGKPEVGDRVILNTTAVELSLGTGGYHFVMAGPEKMEGESRQRKDTGGQIETGGHIMKLRYTPFQLKVCAVEESASPAHQLISAAGNIEGIPVVCGSLHSALVPCVCGIKAVDSKLRIAYVMTDGGALPIALSNAVSRLKEQKLLAGTVTVGHAFGGDYEAINLYSGLLAAAKVIKAQVIIVLMGPGVVGTGTKWGHTALEVGQIINAAAALKGRSMTIARLSFADKRERHYGLSHHTITALEDVALAATELVLPELAPKKEQTVRRQLSDLLLQKHNVIWGGGNLGIETALNAGLELKHMGRKYSADPDYFLAASAAGEAAADAARRRQLSARVDDII